VVRAVLGACGNGRVAAGAVPGRGGDRHRVAAEAASQCLLLRDIFGSPFRRVQIQRSWLAWNGGTVLQLAEGIYEERAFDRLPILADALEEAGCIDTAILDHCRGPGPHVRGCWVIDLILGKG
jgi:hypothetical protein